MSVVGFCDVVLFGVMLLYVPITDTTTGRYRIYQGYSQVYPVFTKERDEMLLLLVCCDVVCCPAVANPTAASCMNDEFD